MSEKAIKLGKREGGGTPSVASSGGSVKAGGQKCGKAGSASDRKSPYSPGGGRK